MKTLNMLSVFILTFFFTACSSTKEIISKEDIYNTTWELEYISGPRIAFSALFPDRKPQITFNKTIQKVEGTDGCNGYTADYTMSGNSISFGEAGPATMMFCGKGEKVFLNTIKKVDQYKIDEEGKLNLMIDNVPMMRFKKIVL